MEYRLNIKGLFRDEQELHDVVRLRKVCYDVEPYYNTTRKGELVQIGYQINIYGTFPESDKKPSIDDPEFPRVLKDVRRVAEALSNTCDPLHMCEATIAESNAITYSRDRQMRPDVTVHVPVFDQQNFGHPVDKHIEDAAHLAGLILETAGIRKKSWED
jgi:hypothetical protein